MVLPSALNHDIESLGIERQRIQEIRLVFTDPKNGLMKVTFLRLIRRPMTLLNTKR